MRILGATLWRCLTILLAAAACASAWNIASPRRIPWFENWDQHVESLALNEGLPLIRMKEMRGAVESYSHLILDARPVEDYEAGHIPGAMNLPYDELHDRLDAVLPLLTPATPIIGYCSGTHCDDALLMLLELRTLGFTNGVLFAEGFDIWSRLEQPVESSL